MTQTMWILVSAAILLIFLYTLLTSNRPVDLDLSIAFPVTELMIANCSVVKFTFERKIFQNNRHTTSETDNIDIHLGPPMTFGNTLKLPGVGHKDIDNEKQGDLYLLLERPARQE